eukprot:gene12674-biopygen9316
MMETLVTVEVQVGELRHDGGKPAKVQYFRVATTGLDAAVPSSRRPAGLPDLTWVAGQRFDVERRYGDAELLRELLCLQCRGVVLPPLPPKKGRSPPEKKDQLELFLQSLVEYCPAEVREEPFVLRFLVEEPGVFRRRTMLAMQQAKAERLEADRPALRRRVLDAFSRTASLVPLLTPQPPPPQDRAATPWGEIAAAAAGTRGTLQRAAEALAAYVASVTAMLAAAGRCAAVAENWAPSPSAEGPAPVEHGPLSLSEVQAALDQSIRCALCAVEYAAQRGPADVGRDGDGLVSGERLCRRLLAEADGLDALVQAADLAHARQREAQARTHHQQLQEQFAAMETRLVEDVRGRVLPQLHWRMEGEANHLVDAFAQSRPRSSNPQPDGSSRYPTS